MAYKAIGEEGGRAGLAQDFSEVVGDLWGEGGADVRRVSNL